MNGMFSDCNRFNAPFGRRWNTERVTNMSDMFFDCYVFNQPLNGWNIGSVVNMNYMFVGCRKLSPANLFVIPDNRAITGPLNDLFADTPLAGTFEE
jgi:hypothetical protein